MAMMQQAVAMLRRVGGLGSTPRLASVPALMQLQRHMSGCKLFIGGLPWEANEETLKDAFSSFGEVVDAKVIVDRATNRSRGYGFVEFSTETNAQAALQEMDGRDIGGRTVRVDYATERQPGEFRSPRPGGRGGYGGGGYGGGRGGGDYGGGGGGGYERGGQRNYGEQKGPDDGFQGGY